MPRRHRKTPLSALVAAPDRQRGNAARGPAQPRPVHHKPRRGRTGLRLDAAAPSRAEPSSRPGVTRSSNPDYSRHELIRQAVEAGLKDVPLRASGLSGFHTRLSGIGSNKRSFAGRFADDLITAALYAPAGLVTTVHALGSDVKNEAQRRYETARHPLAEHERKPLATVQIGKEMGKAVAADIRHPLRHPGFTLLDVAGAVGGVGSTASRVGASSRALSEGGVRAALTRPGFEGGSLLHKPVARETSLKVGEHEVHRLEPDAPHLRPIHRAVTRHKQHQLDHPREAPPTKTVSGEAPPRPRSRAMRALMHEAPPGGYLAARFGPQATVRRELGAAHRVEADIAGGPVEAAAAMAKKLSPAENAALRVFQTEGNYAFKHPDEAVSRHISKHMGWADEGHDPALNREVARDLQGAAKVLRERDPSFVRTALQIRRVSRKAQAQMVREGILSPEAAKSSLETAAKTYGHPLPGVPKGAFYGPAGNRFKLAPPKVKTGAVTRRPGKAGLGPVQEGRFLQGTMRHRTGEGYKHGVVEKPGEAITSVAGGRNRLVDAKQLHGELLKMAKPERASEFDIPIRSTRKVPEHLQRELAVIQEELMGGDESALARSIEKLREAWKADGQLAQREGAPVRWLDSRYLPEVAEGTPSRMLKIAANVNLPFRFGGVYARPAYLLTNRPQNWLMRHLAQGRTRRQVGGTVKTMRETFGPELSAKIEGAGGTTRTQAFQPMTGAGRRFERATVEKITNATDADERFLAVLARAYERGYRDDAAVRRLFASNASSSVVKDRIAIARRARKDVVDFHTSNLEREVSTGLYFYPWMTRGSAWAGRFTVNHPIKAAALAQTGRVGQAHQPAWMRNAPDWLHGYIASRFGLSNPGPLNTFQTPASIGQFATHPGGQQARSIGEEFGTPAAQLVTTKPSDWGTKLLLQGTAPGQIARRLGIAGKPTKSFPDTGVALAFGPFIFGGPFPRQPDKAELVKQGMAALPAAERIHARHEAYATQILDVVKQAGLLPKGTTRLPPQMRKALKLREARFVNRADAKTLREKFAADVGFLASRGKFSQATAKRAIDWADSVPERQDYLIRHEMADVLGPYFDAMYGEAIHDARVKVRDRGYDLPTLR